MVPLVEQTLLIIKRHVKTYEHKTLILLDLVCCIRNSHPYSPAVSKKNVFAFIYCFYDEAPDDLVYDNGCNACAYMYRREPEFFRGLIVTCDEFHHSKNHKSFSQAFNFKHFKNYSPNHVNMNDSACEQRNRVSNRIKKSGTYSNRKNFMKDLRLMLLYDNRRIERRFLHWN